MSFFIFQLSGYAFAGRPIYDSCSFRLNSKCRIEDDHSTAAFFSGYKPHRSESVIKRAAPAIERKKCRSNCLIRSTGWVSRNLKTERSCTVTPPMSAQEGKKQLKNLTSACPLQPLLREQRGGLIPSRRRDLSPAVRRQGG